MFAPSIRIATAAVAVSGVDEPPKGLACRYRLRAVVFLAVRRTGAFLAVVRRAGALRAGARRVAAFLAGARFLAVLRAGAALRGAAAATVLPAARTASSLVGKAPRFSRG